MAGWQPSPGLTRPQWQQQFADLKQVGARGNNGQLWGDLQQGDAGYDPQKAADRDAMMNYGAGQGWNNTGWGDSLTNIGKVGLAALGGYGLSQMGVGAATGGFGPGFGGGSTVTTGGMGLGAGAGTAAAAAPGINMLGGANAFTPAMNATGMNMGGNAAGVAQTTAGGSSFGDFINSIFGGGNGGASASLGGTLGQIGSDLYFANRIGKAGEEAAARADPFASQRPQYQGMLQQHMTDPSSFMSGPVVQNSLDASAKKMASMGYQGSPNQSAELARVGLDKWGEHANLLSNLSGGNLTQGNSGSLSYGADKTQADQYGQVAGQIPDLLRNISGGWRPNSTTSPNFSNANYIM